MDPHQPIVKKKNEVNYNEVVKTEEFKDLIKVKKKFILPVTVFFFCFYMGLPILAGFTDVLTNEAVGSITWAWVYAFLQFVMTWTLCILYSKRANFFDEKAESVLNNMEEEK